jgi:hypothetical protein
MAVPGATRPRPAVAEPARPVPLPSCDATASGAEDGQVQFARGHEEMTLCGHHFRVHELELAVAGWRVIRDDRATLR